MFNLLARIQRFNLHRFSVLFVVISCLPVLLAGFTRFIQNLIPASMVKPPISQDFPLLDGFSGGLSPEPVERAIYLSCLVFLPILLALITPISHSRLITKSRWENQRFDFLLYVATAA